VIEDPFQLAMNPRWEESEFVFCDLQAAARHIRRNNPRAAGAFLEAAYDSFVLLARNPGLGRSRADLGFPKVRSWRITGFRRYLTDHAPTSEVIPNAQTMRPGSRRRFHARDGLAGAGRDG
jgi:plasmid stabilization system protein ParE